MMLTPTLPGSLQPFGQGAHRNAWHVMPARGPEGKELVMYLRVTRVQSPPDAIEKGIAYFKEKVVPAAKATPGNAGAVLLVDRKTGSAVGITFWETAQALSASEQMGITSRTQSAAAMGGSIVNVERFEQVIQERTQPPKAGAFVRLNTVAGAPEKTDNAIQFIQKSLPELKAQKGFRALLMNVDRMTGRSTVASIWDTLADLEASEPKVSGLRRDAADAAGAADVKVEIFETAFAEIKQAARV
jgi:heme-degrading monooxygenase HmoA